MIGKQKHDDAVVGINRSRKTEGSNNLVVKDRGSFTTMEATTEKGLGANGEIKRVFHVERRDVHKEMEV